MRRAVAMPYRDIKRDKSFHLTGNRENAADLNARSSSQLYSDINRAYIRDLYPLDAPYFTASLTSEFYAFSLIIREQCTL